MHKSGESKIIKSLDSKFSISAPVFHGRCGSVAEFADRGRNGWALEGAKPFRTSKVATSRVRSCSGRCAGIADAASATATVSR